MKSKYKNPDKFIAKLKREIQGLEWSRSQLKEQVGFRLTGLTPNSFTVTSESDIFDSLVPGKTIDIRCCVTEVIKGGGRNVARSSEVTLLKTELRVVKP